MMRTSSSSPMLRSANRRLLWLLVLVGTSLFAGSILFIISRAH
jgi:Mg/Co/Ni transporter MgtE